MINYINDTYLILLNQFNTDFCIFHRAFSTICQLANDIRDKSAWNFNFQTATN